MREAPEIVRPGATAQESCQFCLCLMKKPAVVVRSTGERSRGAQEVPYGAAIEKARKRQVAALFGQAGESNLFLALKR